MQEWSLRKAEVMPGGCIASQTKVCSTNCMSRKIDGGLAGSEGAVIFGQVWDSAAAYSALATADMAQAQARIQLVQFGFNVWYACNPAGW